MFEDIQDVFEEIITDDEDVFDIVEAPRRNRIFRERLQHINLWSDEEFVNRFRLSKQSVRLLLGYIEHDLERITNQNHALSPLTQVLVALRFYATGSFLIVAGDFGGIHKSTTSKVVKDVTYAIVVLAPDFIQMPSSPQQIEEAKIQMYKFARFPNCIGEVDCTHVQIQSPGGENAEQFRNRKGYFSLNVQVVADSKLRIRDIVCRWPGAAADQTIFDNPRLKADFELDRFGGSYLVGNKGYTLTEYLMIPLNNPQTEAEVLYNEAQIRTRNVVERLFGVWKRRFPVLKSTMRLKLQTTMTAIIATAILHNIAMDMNDRQPVDENVILDNANFNQYGNRNAGIHGELVREAIIEHYFQNLI